MTLNNWFKEFESIWGWLTFWFCWIICEYDSGILDICFLGGDSFSVLFINKFKIWIFHLMWLILLFNKKNYEK